MKPIMSRRRWQRNQTPIQKQNKLQQTKHRGIYQKIKSPIQKPKPNPSKPNPVTHGHVAVVVIARLVAPYRKS